ncbi:peroxiredoxin-like family protein [Pararhizobium sp. LjRoot238]|uniref:peroxiredoxin-like family protein n=1 Tax=Pararhizobium sp. LjRoot238 TaxID=3342293 RepID=UPI003ED15CBD
MSLAVELKKTAEALKSALPEPIFSAIAQSITDLKASGITKRAASVGSIIPLPVIKDFDGNEVDLGTLAADGPLAISFYRGGWCPYCNVELRALSHSLGDIEASGATVVAITPEQPGNARETAGKNTLGFPVLVDKGNRYARELGIVFSLPEKLRPIYREIGIDLADWNGDESHELPLAATYIVDSNGTVVWAFVDADFTVRAEPANLAAALRRVAA